MRCVWFVVFAACGFHPATIGDDGGPGGDGSDAAAPTCTDGIKNGDELGIDCGGSCAACTSCLMHTLPPATNVTPGVWGASFLTAPTWSCSAVGKTTIDSASGTVTSTSCALGSIAVTNDVAQLDASAPHVFVVRLGGLTLSNGHVLRVIGDKPVVILVAGNVAVDGGLIDASATGATPGPGGSPAACVDAASGLGLGASSSGWGGGGGAFGTAGGQGGYNIVNGGLATGAATLVPLRGGCQGATAAGAGAAGGGGGAIQIAASGTITIGASASSIIAASGGGAVQAPLGGNGGGAGGAILLVAPAAPIIGASGKLRAHGGAGSSGSSGGGPNLDGGDGHLDDDDPATDTSGTPGGGNGNDHGRTGGLAYVLGSAAIVTTAGSMTTMQNGGRGGGGGGGGRIVLTVAPDTASCD